MTTTPTNDDVLRVAGHSNPQKVASAIAHGVYAKKPVVVRCVGAAAVNQALKACAIARGFAATRGLDLCVRPGFANIESKEGEDLSAIVLRVFVL